MMRRTKVICTVGPATESEDRIRELIRLGVNVFRLNMSHATHEWVRMIVHRIRTISGEQNEMVGVLMDTQGPAIRTGDLSVKLDLKPGDIMEFTVRGERSEENYSVDVNYEGLVDDISVGDTVLVDNGVIHLEVIAKAKNRIKCRVITEGMLGSRRHINLPGVKVNLPPLTEKDLADVRVGAEVGVDMVALSFCREPEDLELLRKVLAENGSEAQVIAKIEDQSAVKNILGIIHASDVVMIARGDLGIECPMEELPIIQRRVIKQCMRLGRPVIVATHMLESMISNPVPTRAEVTDVANAVFEQADAVMLSGETTVGRYPLECVKVINRIAVRIERSGGAGYAKDAILEDDRKKTARSAVVLADSLLNSKMVVFTRRGMIAKLTSNLRPRRAPIYAFVEKESTGRKLSVDWGVIPLVMEFDKDPNETILRAEKMLLEKNLIRPGDHLVILNDLQAGEKRYDSIQLRVAE